ncbi:MAG: S8 family serine peptidase [Planctomycetota bacterium]|nr:S8 family serine peptidase [Planctomycetota bacterium]
MARGVFHGWTSQPCHTAAGKGSSPLFLAALNTFVLALVVLVGGTAVCLADTIPNDPYYVPYQWYGPAIGLPAAWSISTGSPGVIVAVLDTGVMAYTPDLAGRVLDPLSGTGSAPLDGTANHHGTWAASVVGMGVDNGIGGAGVGNFTILPVTVTNTGGGNMSDWIAAGIRLAADNGARVINISQRTLSYSILDEAAGYALSKGALTFVASGNTNQRFNLPDYANLVFVSGTDASDSRWNEGAEGSTWGPFVDLSAPADNIVVADPTLGNGYGLGHGTSFATPLAAGAAALVWSINPALTPDEVLSILYTTADDLGPIGRDEVYGNGRINIGRAAGRAYQMTLTPEPGTLVLLGMGLAASVARRLGRRAKA